MKRSICSSVLAASVISIALFAAAVTTHSSKAMSGATKLTLYSIAVQEQFINNEDDRARGMGTNPFGNYHDSTAVVKEKGQGPFAGDQALFAFTLYRNANLKSQVGSAVFTCMYNFNKNAFCNAFFELSTGTMIAVGAFNFNTTKFTLAITGGDGKYRNAEGHVNVSPSPNHAQRLNFQLG